MMMLRRLAWMLLVLALSAGMAVADDQPLRGVALVIGESDYRNLHRLDTPKSDARAMDDLLDRLGFDVERVLDGDERKLRAGIADFIESAKHADVALVYYAGHGIEAAGANYMVPVDADISTPKAAGESLVPVQDLLEALAKVVPVTIVLLDACRTDAFPPGQLIQLPGAETPVAVAETGLGEERGPTPVVQVGVAPDSLGMVIGFAASPGQPALDGAPGDDNSPYAAALLKHLAAGGYSFGDLMTMVGEEVYLKTKARQLPWVNSSLRRVLSFGKPIEDTDPDEVAIRQGRRQLLLSIAAAPDATRSTVEAVARSEDVPLDALYGVLPSPGAEPSEGDLRRLLEDAATQLKAMQAVAPGAAKNDAELARLAGLAEKAQAEGVMALALQYRAAASARADELVTQIDANEANVKADRLQVATTYAENARQAMVSFSFDEAARRFADAFTQAQRWDEAAAIAYKTGQGTALASLGYYRGDEAAQRLALEVYAEVLKLAPREKDPQGWAVVQNLIGNVYEQIAERHGGVDDLQAAVAAFKAAMEVKTRADDPFNWAVAEGNLGAVLNRLSQVTSNIDLAREAVATMRTALEIIGKDNDAEQWATLHYNIGATLIDIGRRTGDNGSVNEGLASIAHSLEVWTKQNAPLAWGNCQYALGVGAMTLASGEGAADGYRSAIAFFGEALNVRTHEQVPLDWAMTLLLIAQSYEKLGEVNNDRGAFDLARGNMTGVFLEMTHERDPLHWSLAQDELGVILGEIGRRDNDLPTIEQSLVAFEAALTVMTEAAMPFDWARTVSHRGWSRIGAALVGRDLAQAEAAKADLIAAQQKYAALGSPDASIAPRLELVERLIALLRADADKAP